MAKTPGAPCLIHNVRQHFAQFSEENSINRKRAPNRTDYYNVSIANMGFDEFASLADETGGFRGDFILPSPFSVPIFLSPPLHAPRSPPAPHPTIAHALGRVAPPREVFRVGGTDHHTTPGVDGWGQGYSRCPGDKVPCPRG